MNCIACNCELENGVCKCSACPIGSIGESEVSIDIDYAEMIFNT